MMIEMRMVDTDCDGISNDKADDMTRDGMPTWYEKEYGVAEGGWQHPYLHNARYALLIAGGASDKGDFFPAFWDSTKEAYFKLVEGYQYQEENVYMMSSRWKVETEDSSYVWKGHNSTTDNIVDGECMWENNQEFDINDAIRMIGKRITKTDFVYVQIYSHGWTSAFIGRDPDDPNKGKVIRHATFQEEINRVWGGVKSSDKKYARAIMVIDTCSSEQAAESFASGKDRIGISSTEDEKYSYTKIGSDNRYSAFLQESTEGVNYGVYISYTEHPGFLRDFGTICSPRSIYHAYDHGYNAATNNYIYWVTGGIIRDYRSWPQIYNEDLAFNTYL